MFQPFLDLGNVGLVFEGIGGGGRIIARTYEVVAEAKAAGMSSKELKEVVDKSYSSDAGPYGPTPDSVMALAKLRMSRK